MTASSAWLQLEDVPPIGPAEQQAVLQDSVTALLFRGGVESLKL